MEVRSNIEKCGTGKASTTATTTLNAIEKPSEIENQEKGQYQSKTTVNETIFISPKMTKDERLVADLKSQIPDVEKNFIIHRRIGEGTFSTVFLTSLKCQERVPTHKKRFFALKYLIPTSHPKRVAQELRCLKEIGGRENVVGVELCLRHDDAIAFIMPYIPHDRFQDYFDKLGPKELQDYMRNLLIALRHVHTFSVIHRDVKPSNFLHNRKNQKYLLVDFGLAQTIDNDDNDSTKPFKKNCRNTDASYACDNEQQQNIQQNASETSEQQLREQEVPTLSDDENLITAVESIELTGDANKNKRKASECEETENKSSNTVLNAPKRARLNAASNATSMINNENTSQQQQQQQQLQEEQQSRAQYIPSSFKSPLKQINEISTPKVPKTGMALDSPLTRQIKSAVLGYSMHSKIQNQRKHRLLSPAESSNSMTPVQPNTQLTTFAVTPPTTTATPENKYKVDNRRSSDFTGRNGVKCYCYGRPTVCNVCLVKREIHAPRQGTPGYRPSEVLLKYPNQTTAVDVWAAGVILISILSGCYPFFKGPDDLTALAEIITVFGDEIVRQAGMALGRHVCYAKKKRPLHLRKLCIRLRNRCKMDNTPNNSTKIDKNCDNCEQIQYECLCQHSDFNMDFSTDAYPDSVYDLLAKLLAINPNNRISADEALQHKFFKEIL